MRTDFSNLQINELGASGQVHESSYQSPEQPEKDVFRSIGMEPLINCMGTYTIIGGSLERPSVRAAMEAASKAFVQYDELADGIGKKLAELTGAGWGMVSAGCAAGMKHVTAACVSGGNPEWLIRIPDLNGFEKTEVVIPEWSRNVYDHSIRNIGVSIISPATVEELEKALNSRTALIYLLAESTSLEKLKQITALARKHNIPVLVDAAADDLSVPNIYLGAGASVVAYSGGKAMCGPQCAGLLLGEKEILQAAWQASSPHHGPGRDNKVGREEMIGMLAAVEAWLSMDHAAEWKKWVGYLNNVKAGLSRISDLTFELEENHELSDHSPRLRISWDEKRLNLSGKSLAEIVGRSKPGIALNGFDSRDNKGITGIILTASQMQPGEDSIVAKRLQEIFTSARKSAPALAQPIETVNGKWDLHMQFFNSKSQQRLILNQDGNWLTGIHIGDTATMEVSGTIDGNVIKLLSRKSFPGDRLIYIFQGSINNGVIEGSIHLGEYRTATFKASRTKAAQQPAQEKIFVPGGPPLAT